ncbi:hypothetical protein ACGFNX_40970 [Streptomyces sp. NPDC048723]
MNHDQQPFVPADFAVPRTLVADGFRLEPLGWSRSARVRADRAA